MGKKSYGQFCPVAKTAEVLAERWMPLVLRELLAGSRHYSELRRGIPLISPAVLSQRLKELVDAEVVERVRAPGAGERWEYRLTEAGQELRPIIRAFGEWGQRWAQHELRPEEVDPDFLMWAMHRRLNPEALPGQPTVLLFELPDVEIRRRRFWFVVAKGEVDICLKSPGLDVDLTITAGIRTLTRIYLGQIEPGDAIRSGSVALEGARPLIRNFPSWCPRSPFAAAARRLVVAPAK